MNRERTSVRRGRTAAVTRRTRRVAAAAIDALEPRRMLSASMVKDLNTGPGLTPGLWNWAGAGSTVFLSQDDGVAGWELYKTDGTAGGTVLVKDIRPGRDNSAPGWLTYVGGTTIYFTADNGTNGIELWKSDGTEAGTVMVRDINPGAGSSSPGYLVNVNGTLFFQANDGVNGSELWKSDGTEAGTVLVKDIRTGAGNSSAPQHLINNNGTLYFRATDGTSGNELYKSDGTLGGTARVTDLLSGSGSGVANLAMAVHNGEVYFSGTTNGATFNLYKSNGTGPGTVVIGTGQPSSIKPSGGAVYYGVGSGGSMGLWRTDGVSQATLLHAEAPGGLTDVGGTLFFGGVSTLYKAVGTTVSALKTGMTFDSTSMGLWTSSGGTFYFGATDNAAGIGVELYKSDGTGGGTVLVKDVEPGPASSTPWGIIPFTPVGPAGIIFGTFTGAGGLWRSDGTAPGTTLIKDINLGTGDSAPFFITPFKNHVYFVAFVPGAGSTGGELYRSDGTEAGTTLFADMFPGATGGSVSALRVHGDYLYFAANDGSGVGKELWRTDGNTVSFVKDINPGSAESGIAVPTSSGNYLYFAAETTAGGEELWRSDGTNGGTIPLTNFSATHELNQLVDVNGTLYFTVSNSGTYAGLYKTDGNSPAAAVPSSFTNVSSMININGTLYFAGTTAANGAELFKLAPGDAAPVLVRDIHTFGSSSPANFTNVDGTLFFSATTSAEGTELWKSNGTEAGTVIVKNIRASSSNSSPTNMVAANGVAYFRADDGVNGAELWRSDGTAAGTYLLKDVTPPGATSGTPTRLFSPGNGFVYFAADNENSGSPEAWVTDGTTAGTKALGDFYPEGAFVLQPSNAAFFATLNGEVYYRFTDDTHGAELWKATKPDFAVAAPGGALTVSGTGGNDAFTVSVNGSGGVVVTLNGMTETFAPGAVTSLKFAGHVGRDTVNVSSGTMTLGDDSGAATANLTLNVAPGANVILNTSQHLVALDVQGTLDVKAKSVIVMHGPAAPSPIDDLAADIAAGRIFSSATIPGSAVTTVGIAPDDISSAVFIQFAYAGDGNLDGVINADDYASIDFHNNDPFASGYWNGDFNYDGEINADDYALIDFNNNAQGAPL